MQTLLHRALLLFCHHPHFSAQCDTSLRPMEMKDLLGVTQNLKPPGSEGAEPGTFRAAARMLRLVYDGVNLRVVLRIHQQSISSLSAHRNNTVHGRRQRADAATARYLYKGPHNTEISRDLKESQQDSADAAGAAIAPIYWHIGTKESICSRKGKTNLCNC